MYHDHKATTRMEPTTVMMERMPMDEPRRTFNMVCLRNREWKAARLEGLLKNRAPRVDISKFCACRTRRGDRTP